MAQDLQKVSTFYVFRCKHCGQWGAKEIRSSVLKASYKCVYCTKSTTVKSKRSIGLNMDYKGPFEHPLAATRVCQALNNLRGRKDEKKQEA